MARYLQQILNLLKVSCHRFSNVTHPAGKTSQIFTCWRMRQVVENCEWCSCTACLEAAFTAPSGKLSTGYTYQRQKYKTCHLMVFVSSQVINHKNTHKSCNLNYKIAILCASWHHFVFGLLPYKCVINC